MTMTNIILAVVFYAAARLTLKVVEKIMGCENITSAGPNEFGKC